jgi:outer membrane receptor protein involved in Fe transport
MGENFQYYYLRNNYIRNHSFGNSNVNAAYLSSDFEINQHLRLIGGLRLEHTNIFVDVDEYNRLGYARGDIRRENVGGFPLVNPGEIQQFDFLPNVSLVYKLKNEELGQTNLRMNYGKSLARPSIRELSDAAILDNEFRTLVYGNSDLKMVGITNYDFRAETYFKSGNMLSASAFYKDFKNHIEMGFGSAGITWENITKSNVLGLEFEGKKDFGDHFELRANVTLVKSKAEFIRRDLQIINGEKVYTILDTLNRPMFGQAPYLVNSMITYNADSIGLNVTASYNVQGPRLVIAGAIKGRPDVYEIPRHMIDLKVSKKLTDHWSMSMTIRDLLNTPVRRAYKIDSINYAGEVQTTEAGWYDYDRFRFGTNYQLSITYKL